MRPIRLVPERHETPQCESFEDEQAVRRFEREMRVHRAFTEPFQIRALEARVDGVYEVSSASAASYLIDIVDGSSLHDTCTCPDFLGNELGTCKHLEAVRRAIASRRSLRSAHAHLGAEPLEPVLTIQATPELKVQPVGPFSAASSAHLAGLLKARPKGALHDAMASSDRLRDGIRIVHAAVPALAILDARKRKADRSRALGRAIAEGCIDPDVLKRPLFPYQREGALHLLRCGRGLLADDMGLGKTVQAIAACEVLRRRKEAKRILVVTAASIKHQWAQEIERYAGERAVVVSGGAVSRREAIDSGAAYIILNYELTWRELTALRELSADVLILDEAQRAKNFRTKTAATLRAIPSRDLFILTGTPIENRLDDLYSLLQLVDPSIFGPLWRYNLDFHAQNERGRITACKNLSRLRERTQPVILRRRKEEVLLQLPPRIEQTRYTALTREQAELEAGYRSDAAKLLAIAERRPLRKEEQERLMMYLLKARQACNAAELCDPKRGKQGSPKLDELEALVSEIAEEQSGKILIFSEWVKMLELASARLDRLGIRYEMLHGGIPTDKRPALLDRFRSDPEVRVLLSTDAGGVGLNLQAASFVVHLDLPWNPARLDQRSARAHRLGQTRGVLVTYLCSEAGIERGIEGTLGRKRAMRDAALEMTSQEEVIEVPSFSVFMRQMRQVLEQVEQPHPGEIDAGLEAANDAAEESPAIAEEPTDATPDSLETPPAEASPPAEAKDAAAGMTETPSEMTSEALATLPEDPAASGGSVAPTAVAEGPCSLPAAARDTGAGPGIPLGESLPQERPAKNRLRLARLVLEAGFFADALRAAYEALAAAIAALASGSSTPSHAALVALVYRDLLPSGKLPAQAHSALARLHDLTSLEASGVAIDTALAAEAVAEAELWVSRLTEGAGGAG